jgi:C-terminal processing protease CtpA/Prc
MQMKFFVKQIDKLLFLGFILISFNSFSQNISKPEMILGISKIWKEVSYNYNYFNNQQKWDSLYTSYLAAICESDISYNDYKHILQQFICSLHEGHSRVNFANNDKKQYWKVGCCFIDSSIFIVANSNENFNELPIGSKIIAINETPVFGYLDSLYNEFPVREGVKYEILANAIFYTEKDSIIVTCQHPDGKLHNATVFKTQKQSSWKNWLYTYPTSNKINLMKDSVLYISLTDFYSPEPFKRIVDSIELLKKSKGIIFDLRHNAGGSDYGYLIYNLFTEDTICNYIYSKRVNDSYLRARAAYANPLVMYYLNRDSTHISYPYYKSLYSWYDNTKLEIDTISQNMEKIEYKYNKPIVILTDERTASAAETFIVAMKSIADVTIIGSETYGCMGVPLFIPIDENITAQVSTTGLNYNNKNVEYIIPDYHIKPQISEILNRENVVLKKGVEFILNK